MRGGKEVAEMGRERARTFWEIRRTRIGNAGRGRRKLQRPDGEDGSEFEGLEGRTTARCIQMEVEEGG